jgi:hypothetical protein
VGRERVAGDAELAGGALEGHSDAGDAAGGELEAPQASVRGERQELDVLAADVADELDLGAERAGSAGVGDGLDLGEHLVVGAQEGADPRGSVARHADAREGYGADGALERLEDGAGVLSRVGAGALQAPSQGAARVEQGDLGDGRASVYAEEERRVVLWVERARGPWGPLDRRLARGVERGVHASEGRVPGLAAEPREERASGGRARAGLVREQGRADRGEERRVVGHEHRARRDSALGPQGLEPVSPR